MTQYFCYWIVSGRCSYIGATVDPARRLRQHCGLIKGGALRTRGKLWQFECVISGFRTWKEALQFEWAAKYYSKRCRSVLTRRASLELLMKRERWTRNSPPACEVPLSIEWQPTQYGVPPESLPQEISEFNSRPETKKCKKSRGVRNTKTTFKNLYGVTF